MGVVLMGEDGNRIGSVAHDSPAEEAGLRRGDTIIELDGKEIGSGRDIIRTMRTLSPGEHVRVRVSRGDEEKTLSLTLGERPETMRREFHLRTPAPPGHRGDDEDIESPDDDNDIDEEDIQIEAPRHHGGDEDSDTPAPAPRHHDVFIYGGSRNFLGVEVHEMSEELREALKAPGDRGVLVNKVVEGSPADEAGIHAGDIIIGVGDESVESAGDIASALRDHDPGDRVGVKVIRNGSERSLDVKVARRPGPPRGQGRHGMIMNLGPEWEQHWKVDGDQIRKAVEEALKASGMAMQEVQKQLREQNRVIREQNRAINEQIRRRMDSLRGTIRANNVRAVYEL